MYKMATYTLNLQLTLTCDDPLVEELLQRLLEQNENIQPLPAQLTIPGATVVRGTPTTQAGSFVSAAPPSLNPTPTRTTTTRSSDVNYFVDAYPEAPPVSTTQRTTISRTTAAQPFMTPIVSPSTDSNLGQGGSTPVSRTTTLSATRPASRFSTTDATGKKI